MNRATTCRVKLEVLRPGDWIEILYGYNRIKFYVIKNDPSLERIWLGNPRWCASSETSMAYSEINDERFASATYDLARQFANSAVYLGRTKRRWWWRFLPFRDIVSPYPAVKL